MRASRLPLDSLDVSTHNTNTGRERALHFFSIALRLSWPFCTNARQSLASKLVVMMAVKLDSPDSQNDESTASSDEAPDASSRYAESEAAPFLTGCLLNDRLPCSVQHHAACSDMQKHNCNTYCIIVASDIQCSGVMQAQIIVSSRAVQPSRTNNRNRNCNCFSA